ncbi:MAG: DPP IV N-terminal domain-containing protein [Planctomycetes bacterium]|nr:DPP IV N-terminal domain-containing protein [Planctomycetota bacterium]
MRHALLVPSVLLAACSSVPAQESAPGPRLTLDKVFELASKFRLPQGTHVAWLADGEEYLALEKKGESDRRELVIIDAASGHSRPYFDAARMEEAFAALPGIPREKAKGWSRRTSFNLSASKQALLLNEANDLFAWHVDGRGPAVRLTEDPVEEGEETFSPDGRLVAFVRDHDLHVVPVEGGATRALTTEGSETVLVGRLDWLYQEEVYGRGSWRAYWWSPDSSRIAFLVLDETNVPSYTIVDHRETHPPLEEMRYPKAGDPNPTARLAVVDVAGGAPRFLDLGAYEREEFLIVRVGWSPDSKEVIFQVQDRIQTWLDLLAGDPTTGKVRRLFRDSTGAWTSPTDAPHWIEEGKRFLWVSERDGYSHLYLYDRDGTLARRLTEGEWDVEEFQGVDEEKGIVYFEADKEDVKGTQLFRVGLDGSGLTAITAQPGTHSIFLSPKGKYFVDFFTSRSEPGRADLCRTDGRVLRTLARVEGEPAKEAGWRAPEFVKVKTRDGFEMEAALLRPAGFEAGRRYPVVCNTYAGPLAPSVRDAFGGGVNGLFHQMLAQEGFAIWICDNRSASGKGLASAKGIHRAVGEQELRDLEDGIDWLVEQGIADPERIGIWGWSYGGYMTSFALTHSKKFKVGIAGAPVTDWRLYDSIYTERYMDVPQRNPEGYKRSSAIAAAANLHGRLMLIHGTIDENVHAQNTLQFAKALQDAGKRFDLMLYPGNRHGITDAKQRRHLYETMAAFFRENL